MNFYPFYTFLMYKRSISPTSFDFITTLWLLTIKIYGPPAHKRCLFPNCNESPFSTLLSETYYEFEACVSDTRFETSDSLESKLYIRSWVCHFWKNDKLYKLIRQNTLFFVPRDVFLSSLNGISTAIQYKFYTNINLFIIQCSLNTDVVACNFCL